MAYGHVLKCPHDGCEDIGARSDCIAPVKRRLDTG